MRVFEYLVRELEIQFWITIIVVLIFVGSNSSTKLRYQPPKDKLVRENIITWIVFLLLLGVSLFFHLLTELYFKESYESNVTYYLGLIHFSRALNMSGIIIKLNFVERKIKKYKHHYITHIGILLISIDLILWNQVEFIVKYLFPVLFIYFSLLPGIYTYIALKNRGRFRNLSLRMVFGLILIEMGVFLRISTFNRIFDNFGENFIIKFGFPYEIINMLLIFVGLSLIYSSYSYSYGG